MEEKMNLIEGIQKEIERCLEVLAFYEKIPQGTFGAIVIRKTILNAEKAMASDDAVEMLRSYKELNDIE